MAIKILVTGDVHIGKRSSALPYDDDKASTKHTWNNLIDYAIDKQVDLLLLTGDVVDEDNKFYEAVGTIQNGFNRLSRAGIPVFMVSGNHDYDVLPQVVLLNDSENIHLIGKNGRWESHTYHKNNDSIRIVGWSFPEKAVYEDASDTFPFEKDENCVTIALIHGDTYSPTSRYNPLNTQKLRNTASVDAWLLGHIHKTNVLSPINPLILYPGSPHSLSSKEQGIHGPYMLTVESRKITFEHIPLSPVYYQTIDLDVSTVIDENSFRNTVISSLRSHLNEIKKIYLPSYIVFDINFTGECDNVRELRQWAENIKTYDLDSQCHVSIRSLDFDVQPKLNVDHLMNDPSYPGVLAAAIKSLEKGETTEFVDKLLVQWKQRYNHLITLPVYSPLKLEISGKAIDQLARKYILSECKELLGELNNQRNEN